MKAGVLSMCLRQLEIKLMVEIRMSLEKQNQKNKFDEKCRNEKFLYIDSTNGRINENTL